MSKREDPRRKKVKGNSPEDFKKAGYTKSSADSLPYKKKKTGTKRILDKLDKLIDHKDPEVALKAIALRMKISSEEMEVGDEIDREIEEETEEGEIEEEISEESL